MIRVLSVLMAVQAGERALELLKGGPLSKEDAVGECECECMTSSPGSS